MILLIPKTNVNKEELKQYITLTWKAGGETFELKYSKFPEG